MSEKVFLFSNRNPVFFVYDLTILSDELTNTNAAEIGMITIRIAKTMLLKNAPNEGVIIEN